jgi:hypothetical protein
MSLEKYSTIVALARREGAVGFFCARQKFLQFQNRFRVFTLRLVYGRNAIRDFQRIRNQNLSLLQRIHAFRPIAWAGENGSGDMLAAIQDRKRHA